MSERIRPGSWNAAAPSEIGERRRISEFTIRGHRLFLYEDLLFSIGLQRSFNASTSLEDICKKFSRNLLKDVKTGSQEDGKDFRVLYGYSNSDDSVPATYLEDVVGDGKADEELYLLKTMQTNLNFLNLPDGKSVRIGTLIDEYCKNCFFGDGRGGAHCPLVGVKDPEGNIDDYLDEDKTREFANNLRFFLAIPEIQRRKRINPERYTYRINTVNLESPLINGSPASSNERTEIQLSLGLARDVLTHTVAKDKELDIEFGIPFYSFQDLLTCRRTN